MKSPGICRGFLPISAVNKPLDCCDGGVADGVFHAAGILGGGFRVYADFYQPGGEHGVPLIDFLRYLPAIVGEGDVAVLVHYDKSTVFQQPDGTADAGLGLAHMLHDVDGAHRRHFAAEHQNRLQIHLSGFL